MPSVFVKTLRGRTLCVEANCVADVKAVVADADGVPAELQILYSAGRVAQDSELVVADVSYDCSLALDGGKKKRKKKTYTKPKKIAHKHRKVKLAVLKYYKVDQSSGKVTRLLRECTHEKCGPGIFMGLHFNRHYCGKCGLTYHIEGSEGKAPPPKAKVEAAPAAAGGKAAPAKGKKK